MRHYFAYGSNMIARDMRRRCPGAREIALASLDGYRVTIAASGYASIARAEGERVHGVLWEIGSSDESALDRYEGIAAGLYRKEEIVVAGAPALVYIETSGEAGRPRRAYLEAIVAEAESRGFPASYIDRLRALGYNRATD